MAVTKGHPVDRVRGLVDLGRRLFGENRVQEALAKYDQLGAAGEGISLHLIGHLQTNKVKLALTRFQNIQTLDSERLAERLQQHATGLVEVMVQVNAGEEPQKSGLSPDAVLGFLEALGQWPSIRAVGLMAVLPEANRVSPLERTMDATRALWDTARHQEWPWAPLADLSMGMSGDFEMAIRYGSTLVRVGTALLGDRPDADQRSEAR